MLNKVREKYVPPVPELLKRLASVILQPQKPLPVKPEIKKLFPRIADQKLVKAKKGKPQKFSPLKIGAVFSGGQAAGGHNVLAALFDALQMLNPRSKLVGFLGGPSGIVENRHIELTKPRLAPYRNQGGFDLLGSGRTKIETAEQLKATLKTARDLKLDGLVVIGGDDSNTNAAVMAEYFLQNRCLTRVVGVPKTIDGDLQNAHVAISFGFDTATKIYSELIGNIMRDALSAKKYYHFIKLMGRSASHITLECGLKTHPNLTLISEERKTLAQITGEICNLIEKRAALKKNYGVILIPEGLIEYMPEMAADSLPPRIRGQLLLDKDPHGNVNVSAIETELLLLEAVKAELKKRNFQGKFDALPHFFGYEGRAGFPTNFDANYCYALGLTAALLVAHGQTACMAFVEHLTQPPSKWAVGAVPLASLLEIAERKGKGKPVIGKTFVDLKGKPYRELQKRAAKWALEDDYQYPGPVQFFGDADMTDAVPLILQ